MATSGQTASSLSAACGAAAVTYKSSALRKKIRLPRQHAATVVWRKEKTPILQIIGVADMRRRRCRKISRRGVPRITTGRVFSSNLTTQGVSFAAALRGKTEVQQQPRTHQEAVPDTMEHMFPAASPQH
jgi:hypothetical protein